MTLSQRVQEIKTGFSSTFWIANTLELFERLAFYGAKAVLAVFIAEKVGLDKDAGSLAGLFTGLIFFLPVLLSLRGLNVYWVRQIHLPHHYYLRPGGPEKRLAVS